MSHLSVVGMHHANVDAAGQPAADFQQGVAILNHPMGIPDQYLDLGMAVLPRQPGYGLMERFVIVKAMVKPGRVDSQFELGLLGKILTDSTKIFLLA
jgi:hypothetical protein